MSNIYVSPEHEFEAQHGLPEPLPANEKILWQGSPDWWTLALSAFHVRKLAIYFASLLVLRVAFASADGASPGEALVSCAILLSLSTFALGLMVMLAWLSARTAVYTITDKRVVMRIGVVLSVTFNLPFTLIESAALRRFSNQSGDIPLVMAGSDRIAYLHLWPHVRPWRLARPEPMLRSVPDAERVAELLAKAMADATDGIASVTSAAKIGIRGQNQRAGVGLAAVS